jgi:hypothetical protein
MSPGCIPLLVKRRRLTDRGTRLGCCGTSSTIGTHGVARAPAWPGVRRAPRWTGRSGRPVTVRHAAGNGSRSCQPRRASRSSRTTFARGIGSIEDLPNLPRSSGLVGAWPSTCPKPLRSTLPVSTTGGANSRFPWSGGFDSAGLVLCPVSPAIARAGLPALGSSEADLAGRFHSASRNPPARQPPTLAHRSEWTGEWSTPWHSRTEKCLTCRAYSPWASNSACWGWSAKLLASSLLTGRALHCPHGIVALLTRSPDCVPSKRAGARTGSITRPLTSPRATGSSWWRICALVI